MKAVVADTSYVVEGLLNNASLFDDTIICTASYGLYEILNVIWKHQVLLKRIKDGKPVVDVLFGLIHAGRIQLLTPQSETMKNAYTFAVKTKVPVYDIVFIALAKQLGTDLLTFDKKQAAIFRQWK
ncbi:MAG: type II toxin-antitoxin system VapC family toxin [Candidatus Nitrosotenuis sp.]